MVKFFIRANKLSKDGAGTLRLLNVEDDIKTNLTSMGRGGATSRKVVCSTNFHLLYHDDAQLLVMCYGARYVTSNIARLSCY
jgi:hypothetical protein